MINVIFNFHHMNGFLRVTLTLAPFPGWLSRKAATSAGTQPPTSPAVTATKATTAPRIIRNDTGTATKTNATLSRKNVILSAEGGSALSYKVNILLIRM